MHTIIPIIHSIAQKFRRIIKTAKKLEKYANIITIMLPNKKIVNLTIPYLFLYKGVLYIIQYLPQSRISVKQVLEKCAYNAKLIHSRG